MAADSCERNANRLFGSPQGHVTFLALRNFFQDQELVSDATLELKNT